VLFRSNELKKGAMAHNDRDRSGRLFVRAVMERREADAALHGVCACEQVP
jgi:hypothetical protein